MIEMTQSVRVSTFVVVLLATGDSAGSQMVHQIDLNGEGEWCIAAEDLERKSPLKMKYCDDKFQKKMNKFVLENDRIKPYFAQDLCVEAKKLKEGKGLRLNTCKSTSKQRWSLKLNDDVTKLIPAKKDPGLCIVHSESGDRSGKNCGCNDCKTNPCAGDILELGATGDFEDTERMEWYLDEVTIEDGDGDDNNVVVDDDDDDEEDDGDDRYKGDYFMAIYKKDKDLCMGNVDNDFEGLNLHECNKFNTDLHWYFYKNEIRFRFRNPRCVDARGGDCPVCVDIWSLKDGSPLESNGCDKATNKKWAYNTKDNQEIASKSDKGLCIAPRNKPPFDASRLGVHDCNGSKSQAWSLVNIPKEEQYFMAVLEENPKFCIDVDSSKQLILDTCKTSTSKQRWFLFNRNEWVSKKYDQCVDKTDDDDEYLHLVECKTSDKFPDMRLDNQKWYYDRGCNGITKHKINDGSCGCVSYNGSPSKGKRLRLIDCTDSSPSFSLVDPKEYSG